MLLSAALCLFYRSVYALADPWTAVWPAVYLLQFLVPVAGGTILADRYGIRTCVLVMPAIHVALAPALYSYSIAVSPLSYMITCCYTVVSVAWMLRARSMSSQIVGLFVPWLVAAVLILRHNFPDGLVARAIGQALILSALALSVLLYYRAYSWQTTRNVDLSDLATS